MKKPWIPRSFDLMHRPIQVVMDKQAAHSRGLLGEAQHSICRIVLSPDVFDDEIENPHEAAAVFWHEVWHHMMSVLGESDLQENERMADAFGGLMVQMMATADWTPPEAEA